MIELAPTKDKREVEPGDKMRVVFEDPEWYGCIGTVAPKPWNAEAVSLIMDNGRKKGATIHWSQWSSVELI